MPRLRHSAPPPKKKGGTGCRSRWIGGWVCSQSGSGHRAEEIAFLIADGILVIHSTDTFIPSQPQLIHFLKSIDQIPCNPLCMVARRNDKVGFVPFIIRTDSNILRRNCLLQQVIEGKIKREIEVKGWKWKWRRKLLDDLTERRGYSHLKEEALDRKMCIARFGRGLDLS
jgi:hypothetical protein